MLCKRGHEKSGTNLYTDPTTGRKSCRECQRIYAKKYRDSNKDKISVRNKAYEVLHPRIRQSKENYKLNRERVLSKAKKYYLDNREARKAYQRDYERCNRVKARERERRRRAVERSGLGCWPLPRYETNVSRLLLIFQEGLCYYCCCPLIVEDLPYYHMDHMIPISRGGLHCITNVCLACPPCNSEKKTKTSDEFLDYLVKEKKGPPQVSPKWPLLT